MKPEWPQRQADSPWKSIFSAPKSVCRHRQKRQGSRERGVLAPPGWSSLLKPWLSRPLSGRSEPELHRGGGDASQGRCREPKPVRAGEAFPLRLGPPSGAANVHWLGVLKEACRALAPPGTSQTPGRELAAALPTASLGRRPPLQPSDPQPLIHSRFRSGGGWGSAGGIWLFLKVFMASRGATAMPINRRLLANATQ